MKISTEVNELVAVESSDNEKAMKINLSLTPRPNKQFESLACTSSNSSDVFVSEDDCTVA